MPALWGMVQLMQIELVGVSSMKRQIVRDRLQDLECIDWLSSKPSRIRLSNKRWLPLYEFFSAEYKSLTVNTAEPLSNFSKSLQFYYQGHQIIWLEAYKPRLL